MPDVDVRDAEEHAEVAKILADLPPDHPARMAYARGESTIALTRLVDLDRARRLKEAFLAGYRRLLNERKHFRP